MKIKPRLWLLFLPTDWKVNIFFYRERRNANSNLKIDFFDEESIDFFDKKKYVMISLTIEPGNERVWKGYDKKWVWDYFIINQTWKGRISWRLWEIFWSNFLKSMNNFKNLKLGQQTRVSFQAPEAMINDFFKKLGYWKEIRWKEKKYILFQSQKRFWE